VVMNLRVPYTARNLFTVWTPNSFPPRIFSV
jgi:hypothetical protein